MLYLDSSAIVKLCIEESESEELRTRLAYESNLTSSALSVTETIRALRPHGASAVASGFAALSRMDLIELARPLLESAAALEPARLRSLDAIHVSSALLLGPSLRALITYDSRMREAAETAGLRVESPGQP